jgi:hypothetical protein
MASHELPDGPYRADITSYFPISLIFLQHKKIRVRNIVIVRILNLIIQTMNSILENTQQKRTSRG